MEERMAEWREECAVFGIHGADRASELVQLGLYALQHRGQESTGIVSAHDGRFFVEKGLGLVADVMTPDRLARLPGRQAIGHNRYSTTGGLNLTNASPLTASIRGEEMAIAHNGNLVNALAIRRRLEEAGSLFQTSLDTEVFLHLMAAATGDFEERLAAACAQVKGAYALVLMTSNAVYGLRDAHGWRPLVLGRLESGAHLLASESCALDLLGAAVIKEVPPGALIRLDARGVHERQLLPPAPLRQCIFEHIYFSRPDSVVYGETVDRVRRRLGRKLAEEQPAEADLVIAVPDSSNSIALGYAERSGLPFELGLIRNHYVGRTFIHPTQAVRDHSVRVKFNAVGEILRGKRVVMVDDSIVRGTTSKKLVALVRRAGAREVHMRVGSPPVSFPCFYGIDTPSRSELIGARLPLEEIRRFLDVDSIGYLSEEGMKACESRPDTWCDACFTGRYPIPPGEQQEKLSLEGPRIWGPAVGQR
jgi:amidophosphoribosyltransferase